MAFNISYVYIAKDRFTAVSRKVKRSADKVTKSLRGVQKQSKKTGDSFGLLATRAAALAGFMASLRIFAQPIKQAMAFESAMADLNKVMDFKLPSGLKRTGRALQDLSKKSQIATNDLVAIAVAGAQLGIVEKDILGFTETVSKISVAFDIMPGEAGAAVAKLSNIFEIPVAEFESFADSINEVSNNTASAADEIVRALRNKGAAAGVAMNLTSRETVALASTFIQLGINADRVGSVMDTMSRRLLDTSIVGEGFAQAFADNPMENLLVLFQKINALPTLERNQALTDVFGEMANRVGAVARTMDDRLIPTLKLATDLQAAAGSVQKEFATRSATSEAAVKRLSNRMGVMSSRIGEGLLPSFVFIVDAISKATDGITSFIDATGPLVPMIVAAAGAFALIKAAALAWAVAQSILNVTLFANPIGLVVAGLAALFIGLVFVLKKVKAFGGFANVFKVMGQSIINFLVKPLMNVAKIIDFITGTDLSGKLTSFIELEALKIEPPAAAGAQETNTTVDVNLNAPAGVIQSTEVRTKGPGRTNVGQNMALAGG